MVFLKKRKLMRTLRELLKYNFIGAYIMEVAYNEKVLQVTILLPTNRTTTDLVNILPNMQEELNALDYRIIETKGKLITVQFGRNNLTGLSFNSHHIQPNTLKIKFPTTFGDVSLNLEDGASCHILIGGTTRMGKTSLLLYLTTLLYIQTDGEIEIHITSTKPKDFYPFENIENVTLSKTEDDLIETLDNLIIDYKYRDSLLYTFGLRSATDAKDVKKKYPDKYYLFKPIFLIIDEYARFSENKEIQKKVTELTESAGYLNVHVIISTQRPDANTVLKPRIKANLLARICFTTTDQKNSFLILDQFGAERLGKIQGRAIFLDSETNIIQIPYMSHKQSEQLLKQYKGEIKHAEKVEERSRDIKLADKVESLFTKPNSEDGF